MYLLINLIFKYHQLGDYDLSLKEKKLKQKEMYKNALDVTIDL